MLTSADREREPSKRMLLKRGTGSGERGAGNGERGTEVWERVVSGNLHKNPKWRSKKKNEREKEEDEEGIRALVEIRWGRNCQIRLTFYVYVLSRWYVFFDIQPVSFTI